MYGQLKFKRGGIFTTDNSYRHISRTINTHELIIVTDGKLCMEIDGEQFAAVSGDVLRILPGEPHGGYEYTDGASFFWLHFDGALPDELPERITRPKNFDRTILLAKEVLHYSRAEGYPEGITECIFRALLAEISHRGDEPGSLIASIKEYVRKNRAVGLEVGEVAERFGYNADYLNRYFKSKCAVGLKQYINTARLDAIKQELLIGEGSLADIAERCGFSDYKYFLKFFKYHAGMSPSEYRETYYEALTN